MGAGSSDVCNPIGLLPVEHPLPTLAAPVCPRAFEYRANEQASVRCDTTLDS